jgi:hypothetical protein
MHAISKSATKLALGDKCVNPARQCASTLSGLARPCLGLCLCRAHRETRTTLPLGLCGAQRRTRAPGQRPKPRHKVCSQSLCARLGSDESVAGLCTGDRRPPPSALAQGGYPTLTARRELCMQRAGNCRLMAKGRAYWQCRLLTCCRSATKSGYSSPFQQCKTPISSFETDTWNKDLQLQTTIIALWSCVGLALVKPSDMRTVLNVRMHVRMQEKWALLAAIKLGAGTETSDGRE